MIFEEPEYVGRRQFLGMGAAFLLSSGPAVAQKRGGVEGPSGPVITPERFGARGDGGANDTDAFAQMCDFVNRRGGGVIVLRQTTYLVGQQGQESPYDFQSGSIMSFFGCDKGLTILGNGARLRCASGLRYGTFDPLTGVSTHHTLPFYDRNEMACPYYAMISVEHCSGPVSISDLELDGNVGGLMIGGQFGDTGWQVPAYGIFLNLNTGSEQLSRIYTHHHGTDGLLINGAVNRESSSTVTEVASEYNGRQGCSFVSGCNYTFTNCQFNHTGKAGLMSAPGAGIDIEAEVNPIRNLTFTGCLFSNNAGVGMVADSGDSEGVTFNDCGFIGTTCWSVWPKKPRFRFNRCRFVGAIVSTFGDPDRDRAAQFHDCVFYDDPALSPTGEVYGTNTVADLYDYQNVLMNRCRFQLTANGALPWSINAIYQDCVMSQVTSLQAYPRGTYVGTNTIQGNVDLYGSAILGDLYVNGRLVPRTG